jgi:hypothetical protein
MEEDRRLPLVKTIGFFVAVEFFYLKQFISSNRSIL